MKKYCYLWLTYICLLFVGLNFTACSDDDEEVDLSQFEGTWGLVREELRDSEGEWSENYDPFNPNEDSNKIVVTKSGDNTYTIDYYGYYNGWHKEGTDRVAVDGNIMTLPDGSSEVGVARIAVCNSDELVIESEGAYDDGHYEDCYSKMIYRRM